MPVVENHSAIEGCKCCREAVKIEIVVICWRTECRTWLLSQAQCLHNISRANGGSNSRCIGTCSQCIVTEWIYRWMVNAGTSGQCTDLPILPQSNRQVLQEHSPSHTQQKATAQELQRHRTQREKRWGVELYNLSTSQLPEVSDCIPYKPLGRAHTW